MNSVLAPRAGFCDIAGHANERTVIAAIIPGGVVCGNKVPTCRFSAPDAAKRHLIWVGLANSFVFDWVARRRLSTSLNYFHLREMPFPNVDTSGFLESELAYRVAQLTDIEEHNESLSSWLLEASGYVRGGNGLLGEAARRSVRARVEALGCLLFQVQPSAMEYIWQDFSSAISRMGGEGFKHEVYQFIANYSDKLTRGSRERVKGVVRKGR